MELAPGPFLDRKRSSVADAKLAYFDGDFDRCLEVCSDVNITSWTIASEVALIRARAYLRTGRPREAQQTIVATRDTHATLDAWLTAQMLEATAIIRQDDASAGIAMLEKAATQASGAHFAIRSEIAFCTALGYWAKREIDVAETYLQLVDPRSDIIHARALELQAWCHTVRQDYAASAAFFRLTLVRLDDCQARDRAVAATAISTLAILAAELFDRDIASFVEQRTKSIAWSSGLRAHQYVTLEHQALFYEFAGNTLRAYELASQAQQSASTIPHKVCGWSLRSAIAAHAGEGYSAIIFAQCARELLDTLDPRELSGEERFAILDVAERCAQFDTDSAMALFADYTNLRPIDAMLSSARDPRRTAYETFVAGVIAQARGESSAARFRYRQAFESFRGLGYTRRAVIAAHALLKMADDDDLRTYIEIQTAGTVNYITNALDGASSDAAAFERRAQVASLTRGQREVVDLVCMGKTNREIAQMRNVGEQAIKNLLTKSVFPAFGVASRAALIGSFLNGREP